MIEKIVLYVAEFLGETLGCIMRIVDYVTGKRKNWHDERK